MIAQKLDIAIDLRIKRCSLQRCNSSELFSSFAHAFSGKRSHEIFCYVKYEVDTFIDRDYVLNRKNIKFDVIFQF